ncbi:hypothetical protein E1301_Tti022053 [Triplophysa tibetana]|uniref:Uncharacterized protein n=1 Tax=Triplophysa tibetana TaxID=1572043 RepID=A0A5A9N1N0_9TELE|nr:hypothetical protein E1301_Tti022053 [Triplophysa tibetana]
MDIFNILGSAVVGVTECALGVTRAVVDVPLGIVKGAVYSTVEAGGKMMSVGSPTEALGATFVLLASPVTGAVVGGTNEVFKAPEKVVQVFVYLKYTMSHVISFLQKTNMGCAFVKT